MMRIDLPRPLAPGQSVAFSVDWNYNINDQRRLGGRTGYEFFPKDGNYLYEIAQWFPRMAAYNDVHGLAAQAVPRPRRVHAGVRQLRRRDHRAGRPHRRLDRRAAESGRGADRASSATGSSRRETADKPVFIVTPDGGAANEKRKRDGQRRPGSSRPTTCATSPSPPRASSSGTRRARRRAATDVMAMSFYPKEGNPLWAQYSTQAIIHTLERLFALLLRLSVSGRASRSTARSAGWNTR